MCGILGYISNEHPVDRSHFQNELLKLKHRGPDANDVVFFKNDTICLGHTRLSFLDLSDAGKQPMSSSNQKCWITFNGEVYNFLELREELKDSYLFQTGSDTEVLLAAYQVWGISFVKRLKGMFAFGLLDLERQKAFLVRDRFGIKPMYYSNHDGKLIFASELKSILELKSSENQIDFSAFCDFFVYRYIPSPKTIWQDIYKLPPAHLLTFDILTLESEIEEYWTLHASENRVNDEQIVKQVGSMLMDSVSQHTRADVSVGSFLSGGYDSSALVVMMEKLKMNPQTFSIGFKNWEKSEDQFAKIVAEHLNVGNKSIQVGQESLDLMRVMPLVYDEPIADISIVPTFLVSQLARESTKAVLSGEGADEIFGGYTWQHEYWKRSYPTGLKDRIKNFIKPLNPVLFYSQAMAMGMFDRKELEKMLHPNLHSFIPKDVYWFYRSHYKPNLTPLKAIQYLDIKCFMGELVLTKIDRASMANSLEVRVPFLDHELVEYIFSLDEKIYFDPNQTKKILFEQIKDDLPSEILERKKQGFVGPDSYYMNIEWYREQFRESTLVEHNIIQKSYLDELLQQSYNWKLWKILVMENWFKKWLCD